MSSRFNGKVVVVSGGSRGIGRAIALAVAREGAQTVLAAASADNLAKAAGDVAAVGPEPLTVAADLRQLAGCQQVFDVVTARFGRCDVLVNSAGATQAGSFTELADEAWLDGYALKLFGCVRLTRLFWPMLKAAKGNVINIVGGAARSPGAHFLIGGSVNAAMANFSKGLSQLGKRDDVNVNVIHPGLTETDRVGDLIRQQAAAQGKSYDEVRAGMIERNDARRLGTVDDVAALAVFLCTDAARHINGTAIAVDGGATPGFY